MLTNDMLTGRFYEAYTATGTFVMFRALVRKLSNDGLGQDLAEYCLLTALVALVAFGIFYYVSGGVHSLWTTANTALVDGNTSGGGESVDHAPNQ